MAAKGMSRRRYPEVMTIEQAASFLQIATTDTERWQATEKLASCIQKRGKHVRIWRHGLVEWFFDKDQDEQ